MSSHKTSQELRVIHTARTESEINKAARDGYFPLVKKLRVTTEAGW